MPKPEGLPRPEPRPDSPARRPNPLPPKANEIRKRMLATTVDKPHWDQSELDQALIKLFTVRLQKCGAHRCEEVEDGVMGDKAGGAREGGGRGQ